MPNKLKFLGTGSAFNPRYGNTSAYFIHEDDLHIFDCGETIFANVKDLLDIREFKNVYVLITHLHGDHIGSLSTLAHYMYHVKGMVLNVIFPNITDIKKYFFTHGVESCQYKAFSHLDGFIIHPTTHVANLECFGYLFRINNYNTIYYSGDANDIPKDILEQFLDHRIDLLYQDCCTIPEAGNVHLYIEKLNTLIPEKDRSRVYVMHYDTEDLTIYEKYGYNLV